MSEQWYLDLDGVRSGPYQTSEVMSLVAEGEILPHHQIALELKSQKWMTILEWRLNQNRSAPPTETSSPMSVSPVQESTKNPVDITKQTPPIERPIENPQVAKPSPVVSSIPTPANQPPTSTKPATTPPASTPPTSKRDPMAEMFDMLQNTKQKREVKAQQSHAQSHAQSPTHSPVQTQSHTPAGPTAVVPPYIPAERKTFFSNNNLVKTIVIGAGITILGFVLGQFFQHQKSSEPSTALKPTTEAPAVNPTASSTPVVEKETEQQTIDRSTDKMTIRAKVPVGNAASNPAPERPKDAQELKDLKKELQELKALKDEIRNNAGEEDTSHMGPPPGSNYEPPAPADSNPDTVAPAEPAANPDTPAGGPANEKDVHY